MKIKHFAVIIFIYLVIVQSFSMYLGAEFNTILIMKFTLFELGMISVLVLFALHIVKFISHFKNSLNDYVLSVIIIWFLYQLVVIMPLLLIEDVYTTKEIFYAIFRRSYFLMIPFFYWYLFPAMRNIENPIRIIQVAGIIIFFFIFFDFLAGKTELTSTGEVRVAQGVTATIFVFMLIVNFTLLGSTKTNYAMILLALVGIVFSNHKSCYFGLTVISAIAILNTERLFGKKQVFIHVFAICLLILIPLSQISGIADNFIGRVSSSFGTDDPNANDRIEHYVLAWDTFLKHPINGTKVNTVYYKDGEESSVPPHSFIFQTLATNGIVGIMFLVTMLSLILYIGYQNRRDPLSFQMFLFLVFYLIFTMLNENFLSTRNVLLFNFAAAMIFYRNKCIEDAKEIYLPALLSKYKASAISNN